MKPINRSFSVRRPRLPLKSATFRWTNWTTSLRRILVSSHTPQQNWRHLPSSCRKKGFWSGLSSGAFPTLTVMRSWPATTAPLRRGLRAGPKSQRRLWWRMMPEPFPSLPLRTCFRGRTCLSSREARHTRHCWRRKTGKAAAPIWLMELLARIARSILPGPSSLNFLV